jgi:hypothetical protein
MKFLLTVALASILALSTALSTAAAEEDWYQVERIAQSIERLDVFAGEFAESVEASLANVSRPPTASEQVMRGTAGGLQRSVCWLRQRFFDGAEHEEIAEQIRLIGALATRVRNAATKVSLFASTRQSFGRLQNEMDWLKQQWGNSGELTELRVNDAGRHVLSQ